MGDNLKVNLEIVEFYPNPELSKKGDMAGEFHVYLTDFDMDIRGIKAWVKGRSIRIFLPRVKRTDYELGEDVIFPIISFPTKEKHLRFVNDILAAAKEFMKSWNAPQWFKDQLAEWQEKRLAEKRK